MRAKTLIAEITLPKGATFEAIHETLCELPAYLKFYRTISATQTIDTISYLFFSNRDNYNEQLLSFLRSHPLLASFVMYNSPFYNCLPSEEQRKNSFFYLKPTLNIGLSQTSLTLLMTSFNLDPDLQKTLIMNVIIPLTCIELLIYRSTKNDTSLLKIASDYEISVRPGKSLYNRWCDLFKSSTSEAHSNPQEMKTASM